MPDNGLLSIYDTLYALYGDLNWWPAETPYEVITGAILTQNTSWRNVEKAIAGFGDRLSPEFVTDINIDELKDIIRPAGFFNQKAGYLKAVTKWFSGYGCDVPAVQKEPLDKLRKELLSVKGVGPETADAILLYAFSFQTFVVDAYTARLCQRYPIDTGGTRYESIKNHFEMNLPKDTGIYNNFHALIVMNAKDHCRRREPVCGICPLSEKCGMNIY